MPGLPYGVVETRGNTLSVSNDPVPGHHIRLVQSLPPSYPEEARGRARGDRHTRES